VSVLSSGFFSSLTTGVETFWLVFTTPIAAYKTSSSPKKKRYGRTQTRNAHTVYSLSSFFVSDLLVNKFTGINLRP
jgi:hypothetical protein